MRRHNSIIAKIKFKLFKVKKGKKVICHGIPSVFAVKGGRITIGSNVTINSSFSSNYVGMYQKTVLMARNGGKIFIGDNVGISGSTIYSRSSIVIGNNTLIGANTKILDNDFHPSDPEIRLKTPHDNFICKPIKIGNNVFIGCNSIILKGVTIGDNSTIGAGSVVVNDVPANSVVAGNPAKVIKTY